MKLKSTLMTIAVAMIALFAAQSASGAVTLGSDLSKPLDSAGVFCGSTCSWFQSALPGRVAEAPSDGVIVRWRIKTDVAGGPYALQTSRPAGGNARLGIGASAQVMTTAPGVSEFPTRLSVKQGDNIGIKWTSANTAIFIAAGSISGATALYFAPALADSDTRNANIVNGSTEFFVNADLEPDADADGFGDESQDVCPRVSGPVNGCASSALVFKFSVAKRQSVRKLSATVSLDRAGSLAARPIATYKANGKRVTVKGKLTRVTLAPSTELKVALAFSRSQRARISAQLKRGRRVSATFRLVASDNAQGSINENPALRLKR